MSYGTCFVFLQVGPNNVHVALSLVEYKPELQKAMEFVFGTTFVCNNMDNAKKVAFDKRIMTRTVTLGGDVFDPHGTLSGGMFYIHCVNSSVVNSLYLSLSFSLSLSPNFFLKYRKTFQWIMACYHGST